MYSNILALCGGCMVTAFAGTPEVWALVRRGGAANQEDSRVPGRRLVLLR